MSPLRTLALEHRVERFYPFLGLFRINIGLVYHVYCLC